MAKTLKEKTAQGLVWSAVNSGMTQLLNLVIGIFLARMLLPGDYGIVGVLTIFTAIAGCLQASGFTQGLINLKQPTANDYNSVFWFNTTVSLVLYAILFCCAPLIAWFFHQPVLVGVSRFVFLSFVISSFGIAQNAYMVKNMMQREIAISSVLALVVSGSVGLLLAFLGKAYWSLAWQQVVYITVLNAGRYYYADWRPSLHIDMGPVKRMFRFSVKILFTNIINTLSQHLLTFIFGHLFHINTVGNYSQANKWNTMASSTISNTLGQVAQTVLVSVEDERERELRIFRKMLRLTAFLSFPALFGLSLVSREFILCLLKDKWADAIPLLQILCVGGAFLPFYTLYQNLAISNRRSDLYMWCNIAQIVAQLAIVLLLSRYGIMVIVYAYTAFTIGWLLVWQLIARRLIGLRFWHLLLDTMPFMLAALAVMAATYFLTITIDSLPLLLISRIVLAALLYFAVMKAAKVKILDECIRYFSKKTC
jgi:O-antigen/teichoic acid export membrane protein